VRVRERQSETARAIVRRRIAARGLQRRANERRLNAQRSAVERKGGGLRAVEEETALVVDHLSRGDGEIVGSAERRRAAEVELRRATLTVDLRRAVVLGELIGREETSVGIRSADARTFPGEEHVVARRRHGETRTQLIAGRRLVDDEIERVGRAV